MIIQSIPAIDSFTSSFFLQGSETFAHITSPFFSSPRTIKIQIKSMTHTHTQNTHTHTPNYLLDSVTEAIKHVTLTQMTVINC